MAWDSERHAIYLQNPASGWMIGTSTSTIRPRSGGALFYIFGVDTFVFWNAHADPDRQYLASESFGGDHQTEPGGCSWGAQISTNDVLAYLPIYRAASDQPLRIPRPVSTDPTTFPRKQTCIQTRRTEADWPLRALDGGGSSTVTKSLPLMWVKQKDPCVVRLPNGDWLMLLVRCRQTRDIGVSQSNAFCDIVGYVSPDPEFNVLSDISGPYWLVDSFRAVPEVTGARLWLGVPGGVVIGNYLYVYYQAEDSLVPEDSDTATLADSSTSGETLPRAGIAVKKIPLRQLYAWTDFDEESWEAEDTEWGDHVVPGKHLGMTRKWFRSATGGEVVASFESIYPDPKHADPDPVRCGAEEDDDFALFFSAIGDGGHVNADHGFGIWRASPIAGGQRLTDEDGNTVRTVFGRDFALRATWDSTGAFVSSRDQIADSDFDHVYLDPDGSRQSDGSWKVCAGVVDETNNGIDYVMFHGEESDVCAPWDQVLDPPPGPAEGGWGGLINAELVASEEEYEERVALVSGKALRQRGRIRVLR